MMKKTRTLLLATAMLFILCSCNGKGGDAAAAYVRLDAGQTKALIEREKDLVIIDVRTPGEYTQVGRIKGAKLYPIQGFAQSIAHLGKYREKPVLLYCRSGSRSAPAAKAMVKAGFKKVYELSCGTAYWTKNGFKLEQVQRR